MTAIPPNNPNASSFSQKPNAKKKILVVDDDLLTLDLVQGMLESAGFKVLTAFDGKEAWILLSNETQVQLIITDAIMPEMDGFSFLKNLKSNAETNKIPVLVLTGRKNMQDTFLALGAESFVTKPIDREKFLAEVMRLANRAAP